VTAEECIDLPHDLATDTGKYCASLGHKVNHAFAAPNCRFDTFGHPRFGLVPCLVATRRIADGHELLANYEYLLSDCPGWYSDLWDSIGKEDTQS
jgi:hypothetical protein